MPNKVKLQKLAELAVKVGVNVQEDQIVVIRTNVEAYELVRLITEEAYKRGAKKVVPLWSDESVSKTGYMYQTIETLTDIPQYSIDQYQYFVDQGACFISVSSPNPGLFKDVDAKKLQASQVSSGKALSFFRQHMMGNQAQWTIVAASNPAWAQQVFPEKNSEDAVEALWELIFEASHIDETHDVQEVWDAHNEALAAHDTWLNDQNFNSLKFKNSLGTNMEVGLVKDHIWVGGGEKATTGVYFNPNIPTEENFTMPDKYGVNGKVVASKPLSYQGKIVKDFWFEFKDGKVIDFDAKEGKDVIENLLATDEGSSYTGEIALVEHDSPISQMNRILFSTLFDENASCHMALGRAYPMNIKGGLTAKVEDLEKRGYNNSMSHTDFMFGTRDLSIIGVTYDGKEIEFYKNGAYIYK
jgi:aminopeptidase